MATWITPKTDWNKESLITPTDYNRIRNNLIYLNDKFNEEYPDVAQDIDVGEPVDYTSNYYASMFDKFEDAIDGFVRIGQNLAIGERGVYVANGSFIDYNALNRIEKICERYYNYNPTIKEVILTPSNFNVYVGFTTQLSYSVVPQDAVYTATWSSTDTNVMTVDSNGLVTGVGEGIAQINLTLNQTGKADITAFSIGTAEIAVVKSATVEPSKIQFTAIGDTQQIVINTVPAEANNYTVEWTTSNEDIVSIDNNGLATLVSKGNANITITLTDNVTGEIFIINCECHYKEMITSMSFQYESGYVYKSGTTMYIKVKPASIHDAEIYVSCTLSSCIFDAPYYHYAKYSKNSKGYALYAIRPKSIAGNASATSGTLIATCDGLQCMESVTMLKY